MSRPFAIDLSPSLYATLVAEPERSCSMIVETTVWRERRMCGKPARRSFARAGLPGYELGCCDECFAALVALNDAVFTETVLDELYPLVRP